MVIPVIEHYRAREGEPWHSHDFAAAAHEAPCRLHLRIVEPAQLSSRLCDAGDEGWNELGDIPCFLLHKGGRFGVSIEASSATLPGTVATCSASWPSDIDFVCGFHDRCACGTRSSTRRVASDSCSSSASSASINGHDKLLLCPARGFGCLPDTRVQRRPSGSDLRPMILREWPYQGVRKRDQRAFICLGQAVEQI